MVHPADLTFVRTLTPRGLGASRRLQVSVRHVIIGIKRIPDEIVIMLIPQYKESVMPRRRDEDAVQRRKVMCERVKFLLDYRWHGNQRQMARDLRVSQGFISKIVNGLQGAGRRFLEALARQPGVNSEWLMRGEGQPLLLPPKATVPIAQGVLLGP